MAASKDFVDAKHYLEAALSTLRLDAEVTRVSVGEAGRRSLVCGPEGPPMGLQPLLTLRTQPRGRCFPELDQHFIVLERLFDYRQPSMSNQRRVKGVTFLSVH